MKTAAKTKASTKTAIQKAGHKPVKTTKTTAKASQKPAARKATVVKLIPKAAPKMTLVKSAPKAAPVINRPSQGGKPMLHAVPAAPAVVEKLVEKIEFKKGDYVVYPAHGVGRVEGVESHSIAGMEITLYCIFFEQERMRLKVPVGKARTAGLRKLSSRNRIQDALTTLTGKSRIRRVMWSRRAQEYEAKINSGDPVMIAEVVRDLHRATDQPEQSYSERQIYQAALERLARELAAVEKIDTGKAAEKLEGIMRKELMRKAA